MPAAATTPAAQFLRPSPPGWPRGVWPPGRLPVERNQRGDTDFAPPKPGRAVIVVDRRPSGVSYRPRSRLAGRGCPEPRGALDAYAVATLTRVSGEMLAAAPPAQEGYLPTPAELVFTFLVSIPVAFVLYAWAFAIWSLIPLWIALARIVQHRLSARTGSGT